MEQNDEGLKILAKNAQVQLGDVPVESLSHYRPKRGETANEAAIISLVAVSHSPYHCTIFDEREDSVFISRSMANIKTAEKAAKHLLDKTAVDEAKTQARESWPEYLGLNAAIYLAYDDQHRPVLVLRDPEDVEEDGLLTNTVLVKDVYSSFTVRQSGFSWLREVMHLDKEKKIHHFALATVTSRESPIVIFHREIKDGQLVATDYLLADTRRVIQRVAEVKEEVWLEGEPNKTIDNDTVAEEPAATKEMLPDPPAIIEVAAETPHKNGKIEAECPDCDAAVVRISPKMLGKTKCKSCQTLLVAKT